MERTEPTASAEEPAALAVQAESAVAREDWRGAAAAYEKLVASQPKNSEHRFNLVRAYDELGDAEQALQVLQHPSIAHLDKTKRRLARTYIDLKDYAAAIPLVNDLLAAHPGNPKFEKWKAMLDEKSGPDAYAAERFQRGSELFDGGRFHDAELLFLDLLRGYPGFARASLYLGKIYAEQKRWAEAIAPLRRGLAAEPQNRKLKTTLARALFKDGQVRAAMALLESGDDGNDADALLVLQRCHLEAHNWKLAQNYGERLLGTLPADDARRDRVDSLTDEAAVRAALASIAAVADPAQADALGAAYRQVAKAHPRSPLPWLALGAALAEAGLHGEAAASLREARSAHPANIDIGTALTRAVINSEDEEAILRHVVEAVDNHGGDFEALRWLARYHSERTEWEETVEPARRALGFEPQNGAARVALVHALFHLGRFDEAIGELGPLLASGDKQVEALQLKGDILFGLSRLNDAVRAYEEAAALAPKDPELTRRLADALLLRGDVEGYHRWHGRRRERPGSPDIAEWHGELAIGGKLLVWADANDSIGEQVLQLRFLRHLLALGFELVVEVDERLVGICRRSYPQATVIARDDELPAGIVRQTALDGLFGWFKPDLESLGRERPYLIPGAKPATAERARVEPGAKQLTVGLEWPSNELDEALASSSAKRIDLRGQAPNPDELGTMDLVICGDGDVAHLAGALGIPALIILPPLPSPYWLATGNRSAWYPSARLLRRSPADDGWSATIAEAAAAIEDFESAPNRRPSQPEAANLSPADLADAARCFIAQGPQHYPAYRSALALIERVPDEQLSRELKLGKARLLFRLGEWERARALLESMRPAGEPDREVERLILSVCLAMYDLDAGLPIARALAADDPAFAVTAANILFHAGRNAEALAELNSVAMIAPDTESVSSLFGTLLLDTRQAGRAASYLAEQAAASRSASDYTLLGRTLAELGKDEEAMAAFDAGIAASPEDPAANYWRTRHRIVCGEVKPIGLAALEGQLPDVARDDRVIFFVADNAYFWDHARILLGSIARWSPAAKCHVHVVNPDSDVGAAVDEARKVLPGLSYSHEQVDFGTRDEAHVRTYYASIRFVRLAEIFARAPAIYLCIDSDCIVRGDVAAAPLDAGDVGVRLRYSDKPHASVAAGALLLRPTAAAAKFAGRIAELISSVLETGEAAWFLDQVVLSQTVRELDHGEVRFAQIDMAYVDWFFRDEALIWTGKGPRKFEDDRYLAEASYYRRSLEK